MIPVVEILVVAAVFAALLSFVVQPAFAGSSAMAPSVARNDWVVSFPLAYHLGSPQRGDVVVAGNPLGGGSTLIERVVGLPGETLRIDHGHVYIDGRLLCEPYLHESDARAWTLHATWPTDGAPYLIEPHQYFLLGDDRNVAVDSRVFGPVGQSDIRAWVWARILPASRLGPVASELPRVTATPYPALGGCG